LSGFVLASCPKTLTATIANAHAAISERISSLRTTLRKPFQLINYSMTMILQSSIAFFQPIRPKVPISETVHDFKWTGTLLIVQVDFELSGLLPANNVEQPPSSTL
jgi:hypothetical protein